jgi:hypothetical protein
VVGDVVGGARQDMALATTLPAAAYTLQDFFDIEVERTFRRE